MGSWHLFVEQSEELAKMQHHPHDLLHVKVFDCIYILLARNACYCFLPCYTSNVLRLQCNTLLYTNHNMFFTVWLCEHLDMCGLSAHATSNFLASSRPPACTKKHIENVGNNANWCNSDCMPNWQYFCKDCNALCRVNWNIETQGPKSPHQNQRARDWYRMKYYPIIWGL